MRNIRRQLLLVTALFTTALLAAWHSEPPLPPPGPPAPPVIIHQRGREIEPLRWSWLHWWEANREAWIAPLVQKRWTQDRANDDVNAARERAAAALVAKLGDAHEAVRRAAVLALGRMRRVDAADQMKMLVTGDPSVRVRAAAAFSLGMLGDEASQRFLIGQNYSTDEELVAAICATGLSPTLTDPARRGLHTLGRQRPPLPNAALWSLRQHAANDRSGFARGAVSQSESPWIVSEALLALGQSRDANGHRLLASVALMNADARRLPVFKMLDAVEDNKEEALIAEQVRGRTEEEVRRDPVPIKYVRAHDRLMSMEPPSVSIDRDLSAPPIQTMIIGIEAIYAARLRCAAIIALGSVQSPGSVTTLLAVIREQPNEKNELARGLAALGLGRLGATDAMNEVAALADGGPARRANLIKELERPVRGFAAIGLGMYARPVDGSQGGADRPDWEQAVRVLLGRVADPNELMEVRCAAAVALGLVARTEVLPMLAEATQGITDRDLPLAGYAILGRAMLGDQSVTEPVRRLLDAPRAPDPTTDYLGRRAGVLALGISGGREGLPILTQAWHEPIWINREVMLALGLANATPVANEVIPLLNAASPWERAFMAETLGRLFAPWPDPGSRFVVDSAFTMRDRLLGPYRADAAPFLYDHLIPSLAGYWP